jgi:hypothetical protein
MTMSLFSNKYIKIALFAILVVWMVILLAHPLNLINTDLGRHLKNGEVVLNSQTEVLNQNFYSYTHPEYEFINHHWGSGVVFFLVHNLFGFKGLHIFYILLLVLSFFFVFDLTRRLINFYPAFFSSLFFIPLIASRLEIRPEVFSYLFISIFLWIIFNYYKNNISSYWLISLPLISLFWVNLHIYFIFGLFIILAFIFVDLAFKKITDKTIKLAKTAGFVVLAFLVNPNFLEGVIYPFKIKANYGYRIFENQSIWFLDSLGVGNTALLTYFKILSLIFIIGLVFYLFQKRKENLALVFVSLVFFVLAWFMMRNITLFALIALPAFGLFYVFAFNKIKLDKLGIFLSRVFCVLVLVIMFIFSGYPNYSTPLALGNNKGNSASAQFFKENNIQGPVFNNYDIGSFLIYYLFPEEKVFVDNRPEAYPEDFFQNIYKPLQEDELFWKSESEERGFNVIFFAYRDFTPWAQEFLINRVKDPEWVPVFADTYSIVFLKDNIKNKEIIERYSIPEEAFRIVKN